MSEEQAEYNADQAGLSCECCDTCANAKPDKWSTCTLDFPSVRECLEGEARRYWTPIARVARDARDAYRRSLKKDMERARAFTNQRSTVPDFKDDVKDWANADVETDYCEDSLVAQNGERIRQLVDAHWSYMEKVLTVGQDTRQTYTFDQVMAIRKWDYTSSAAHFYGHGFEDATRLKLEGNL